MDIKDYLREYRKTARYVELCFRELDAITALQSPRMDGMPRSSDAHGLEEQAARRMAILARAEAARAEMLAQLEDIENRVEKLTDKDQKTVIKMHYIFGETWEQVAVAMCMSKRSVFYIHGKALTEMRKDWNDASSN